MTAIILTTGRAGDRFAQLAGTVLECVDEVTDVASQIERGEAERLVDLGAGQYQPGSEEHQTRIDRALNEGAKRAQDAVAEALAAAKAAEDEVAGLDEGDLRRMHADTAIDQAHRASKAGDEALAAAQTKTIGGVRVVNALASEARDAAERAKDAARKARAPDKRAGRKRKPRETAAIEQPEVQADNQRAPAK